MSLRHESLDELDANGIELHLGADRRPFCEESKLVDVRRLGAESYRLLPNGRVGAVRFDDLQIEVTPKQKLGVDHLMFLLGYAKDPGFRADTVTAETYGDLWPAMAQSLVMSVERALTVGLLQGYRTEQEALLTVRGRIAFEDQLRRRPGYVVPLEVRYDEFSPDIAENQILLAAIHLMLGVPRIQPETRRRLLHLAARFAGVTRLLSGKPTPRWQPTRLNDRYHPAWGWQRSCFATVLLGYRRPASRCRRSSSSCGRSSKTSSRPPSGRHWLAPRAPGAAAVRLPRPVMEAGPQGGPVEASTTRTATFP